MRKEQVFTWGKVNGKEVIPGRVIGKQDPMNPIAIYGQTKNILANELTNVQPFAVPESWRKETEEIVIAAERQAKKKLIFSKERGTQEEYQPVLKTAV